MPAAGVSCLFPTMEDSPMFRSKVAELTSQLDPILDRSAALVGGAKAYRDGLGGLVEGTNSWVDSLERFCEGTDEESLTLGGGLVSRFLAAFKELASFNELLRTQVDVLLCERMQDEWSKLTGDVKEAKRKMDKRVAEAEHMKLKHLGHSKARGWRPEIEQAELLAAQGVADEQRFTVARKVTEVETRKRYEFLEAILSAVDAHLQYFRRGQQVFACLEEYLQQALAVVETKRQEEKAHAGALEDAIDAYRVARSLREAALAEAVQTTQQRSMREAGPLQLKPGAMKEVVESHMHTTSESGGAVVTVLHSGYLLKKSSNIRKEWNRRFFVLDSQGMLYYYSNKERRDGKSLQNSVHLLTCTIKPDDEDASLRYCFRVVSPDKTYTLQAEDELDKQEWIEALQSVISVLLNSNDLHRYASGTQQRTPSRPTHTRTPSGTVSLEEYDRALEGHGTKSPFAPASSTNSPIAARPSTSGRDEPPTGDHLSHNNSRLPETSSNLRPRSPSAPLAALRGVPGNRECAECGAPDPDWASLNLGVLLCIECSGVHRNLGVHVSKVRSLTLDVAVWQPHVLSMFSMLGNTASNALWESNLSAVGNQGDAWVWCEDSDSDDERQGLTRREEVHVSNTHKPRPHDRLASKEAFITAKYVQRKFAAPTPQRQLLLWRGSMTGDVRTTYAGLVGGAHVCATYSSPAAVELARRVQAKMAERVERAAGLQVSTTAPMVTALHAAAMVWRARGLRPGAHNTHYMNHTEWALADDRVAVLGRGKY